jgi:hypothetical protein
MAILVSPYFFFVVCSLRSIKGAFPFETETVSDMKSPHLVQTATTVKVPSASTAQVSATKYE